MRCVTLLLLPLLLALAHGIAATASSSPVYATTPFRTSTPGAVDVGSVKAAPADGDRVVTSATFYTCARCKLGQFRGVREFLMTQLHADDGARFDLNRVGVHYTNGWLPQLWLFNAAGENVMQHHFERDDSVDDVKRVLADHGIYPRRAQHDEL